MERTNETFTPPKRQSPESDTVYRGIQKAILIAAAAVAATAGCAKPNTDIETDTSTGTENQDTAKESNNRPSSGRISSQKEEKATAIGSSPEKLYKDFCTNNPAETLQKGLSRLYMRFQKDSEPVIVDACGKDNNGVPTIVRADLVETKGFKDAYVKTDVCREKSDTTCFYRVPDQGRNDSKSTRFVKWSDFGKIPPSYVSGETWKKAPDETWLVVGQLVDDKPGSDSKKIVTHRKPKPAGTAALVAPAPSATAIIPENGQYVTKSEYENDKKSQETRDENQDKKIKENGDKIVRLQGAFDEWNMHERMNAGSK